MSTHLDKYREAEFALRNLVDLCESYDKSEQPHYKKYCAALYEYGFTKEISENFNANVSAINSKLRTLQVIRIGYFLRAAAVPEAMQTRGDQLAHNASKIIDLADRVGKLTPLNWAGTNGDIYRNNLATQQKALQEYAAQMAEAAEFYQQISVINLGVFAQATELIINYTQSLRKNCPAVKSPDQIYEDCKQGLTPQMGTVRTYAARVHLTDLVNQLWKIAKGETFQNQMDQAGRRIKEELESSLVNSKQKWPPITTPSF